MQMVNRTVYQLLECNICTTHMVPPIFQCKEGHVFCGSCQTKMKTCPLCRDSKIGIRCRVLEKLALNVGNVPCAFKKFGCIAMNDYVSRHSHENTCNFQPFICFHRSAGCNFIGAVNSLIPHLTSTHKYTIHASPIISFICNAKNFTFNNKGHEMVWLSELYHCFDRYFALQIHFKSTPYPIFLISLTALHRKHHENRYRISVSGNQRKYSFEGPIWTALKGFHELERVHDCLILPENIALYISGGKGNEKDFSALNLHVEGIIIPQQNNDETPSTTKDLQITTIL